jgi:hypothetical protein
LEPEAAVDHPPVGLEEEGHAEALLERAKVSLRLALADSHALGQLLGAEALGHDLEQEQFRQQADDPGSPFSNSMGLRLNYCLPRAHRWTRRR